MKRNHFFLSCLFSLFAISGFAQTYTPSAHVQVNDAVAPAQATPLEARSMFFDGSNFVYRAYQSPSEVLSYLNTTASRTGNFIIIVDSGGTLQSNGTYLNPHNTFYMFVDSTTSGQLKKMSLFGGGPCVGCLLANNNLSDLGNLSTALVNLNLNNVNNTSDATKNAATVSLTNHTIDASLNTLTNIPNTALVNKTIGLTITSNAASDIVPTTTPAALGASLVLNIPTGGTASRGAIAPADWNFFDGKLDSIHISNDSVYNCVNGTCTLQIVLAGTGAVNSVNGTNTSLLFSPSTGNVLGQVNQGFSFNWTAQHTFGSFAPIFSTLITPGGIFYGDGFGQLLQSGGGSNGQILQSTGGGTAPVFFLPDPATVEGWLGFTPLTAALPSTNIFVGNGSNVAQARAMSGAGSLSNTGVLTLSPAITAGSCSLCNATYGVDGRLTAASNGSIGGHIVAGEGIILAPNDSTIKVDSIWNFRSVAVGPTTDSDANNVYEPVVYRDIHPVILSGTDTIFKMWYDGGYGAANVNYAESYTGKPGTWVKYSGNPIIHGYNRTTILYKHGTDSIYAYVVNTAAVMDLFSSVDGVTFAKIKSNVIPAGSSGTWNSGGVTNSWVIYDTTFKMIVDGSGSNGVTEGLYTSTDAINYSAHVGNPVLTMESPWFTKIGSTYWLWGHMIPKPATGTNVIPSEIYGASSPDLLHWTYRLVNGVTFSPLLARLTNDEGIDSVAGQIADPALVSWHGSTGDTTMMFYSASPDGNHQGSAQFGFQVKCVTAFMPLSQLVTTNENATPFPGFTNYGNNLAYLTVNPDIHYGNLYLGAQPSNFDPPALLQIGGNSTQKPQIRLRVDLPDTLSTSPTGGDIEGYARWLFYTGWDTAGVRPLARDTVAMRGWADGIFNNFGLQTVLNTNNKLFQTDTVDQNSQSLLFHNGQTKFEQFYLRGSSDFIQLNGGILEGPDQIASPQFQIGDYINHVYNQNNWWEGMGVADNSATFTYLSGAAPLLIRMSGGNFEIQQAPSGTPGASIPFQTNLLVDNATGNTVVGSASSFGKASLEVESGAQPQLGLFYNSSIYATIQEMSSQVLQFNGTINGVAFPSNAFPAGATSDTSLVLETTSGVSTLKKVAPNGVGNYQHTIFAPTTGGTVNLVNNQYNIINPAGALLALTVNLPSSPANNSVVYIKYTQTITTVTYGNGTVVDGITGPAAGGLVVLTYDSGTTSWY